MALALAFAATAPYACAHEPASAPSGADRPTCAPSGAERPTSAVPPADDATSARSVVVDGCRVALERRATEPVLRLRASCPLTADATRDALARLLAASFGTAGVPPGIRSVALGRLDVFPWLAERLATAAARDPGWDAARGIPRRGHPNAYVASLLDRGALHVELVRVLRAAGAVVRGSAVEKVLVAQAGATPVAAALADAGVAPRSAIPFDAQVWLVLEPAPPAPAPPHDSLHEPH